MAFSILNLYNLSWVDLSDYVINATEVGYISRNRDWTLRTETLNIQIAGTLRNVRGSSYNFEAYNRFIVKDGSTYLFAGIVDESIYKYDGDYFDVKIKNVLTLLKDYQCNYNTVHNELQIGGTNWYEYVSEDHYGNAVVGITWLLEKLFKLAGLILDTTETGITVLTNENGGVDTFSVQIRQFLIDEDMFYCTNQNVATDPSFNPPEIDQTLTPTFFDYISDICSVFGFFIHFTGMTPDNIFIFTLFLKSVNYNISDDYKYEYERINRKAEYKQGFSGCDYAYSLNRANYRSTGMHALTTYTTGGKRNKVHYYKNLFIFYANMAVHEPRTAITNAVRIDGLTVRITSPAHNVTGPNEKVLFEEVLGMTDLNGVRTVFARWDVNVYDVLLSTTQTYTSGGWGYKLNVYSHSILTPNYQSIHLPNSWNTIYYKMLADIGNNSTNEYISEKIKTSYQTTFLLSVLENFIDLKEQTSNIVQEAYQ